MFGYITPNFADLEQAGKERFRAVYCGLCHVLKERHGLVGSATLSYDLTFLALLLHSLYEPDEQHAEERCIPHPVKRHAYFVSEPFEYVADMNIALAYHKCMDDWADDRRVISLGEAKLLGKAYDRVSARYPGKCLAIEKWLDEIHEIEKTQSQQIDLPVNSTGRMLGELFVYRDDIWSDSLRTIGDGMGRFIYFMDAYEDLPEDIRRNRYNVLKEYRNQPGFEDMCRDAMVMMVADGTQEFEQLPLVQDVDLLRNILYSGIWSKYIQILKKKEAKSKGAE